MRAGRIAGGQSWMRCALLAGVLLVAAPERAAANAREAEPEALALVERPLELLGNSRESVEGVLGPPVELDVGLHRNRHRAKLTDTLYSLRYPHLRVAVYEAMSGRGNAQQLLVSVTLTRTDRRLTGDLRFGATRSGILALLGDPSEESDDYIEYRSGAFDETAYSVGLELRNDRLQRITWHFPID